MVNKIKITCDSTCDLTPELYEQYKVEVVPLGIILGEELYYDGVNITVPELYNYADTTGTLPKTSAISVGTYFDVFSKYVNEGYSVIHINISSEFSACYQNACMAADDLKNVYPIDSRNLSSGSGHLVIEAAKMAEAGMAAEDIVARLNEMKERLDVSFVVQTLEYLKMGGRCSSVAALGANILQLRPEIIVTEGKMTVARKYRGSMQKSLHDYVYEKLHGRDDLILDRIFVTHSPMDESAVEEIVALVKELQPFKEVIVTEAGCTISSHCGPRCLGVLFFTK